MTSPPTLAIIRVGHEAAVRGAARAKIVGEMRFIDYLIENVARHGFDEIVVTGEELLETFHCGPGGKMVFGASVRTSASAVPAELLHQSILFAEANVLIDGNYLALNVAARPSDLAMTFGENAGLILLKPPALEALRHRLDGSGADVLARLKQAGSIGAVAFSGAAIDFASAEGQAVAHTLPALMRRGAAFFDRDNTLIRDRGYTYRPEDLTWLPGAIDAIRACNEAGLLAIVVTNQSGIGRGFYSESDMRAFHAQMQTQLRQAGAHIDAFYHCPYHASSADPRLAHDNHPDRKPDPGMLRRALLEWPIDHARSFLIGDREIDVQAATAAGIQGIRVDPGQLEDAVHSAVARPPPTRTGSSTHSELQARANHARSWLFEHALPLWWRHGFDAETRSFNERLNFDATALPTPRRVRVQARQTIVYAYAGRMGWSGPWREAVDAGAVILLHHARRSDGGTRHIVPTNNHQDNRRDLYDSAFVLFGCAAAAEASTHRAELIAAGEKLYAWLETHWRRPDAGFTEGEIQTPLPRRQNPHMHLFEALLGFYEATGKAEYLAQASRLADLFKSKLFDSALGAVPEYFDDQWHPIVGEQGRVVEPGHQFEWAWLLDRWRKLGGGDPGDIPQRLRVHGETYGVESGSGRIYDEIYIEGPTRTRTSRLWPHTERIKASIVRYERTGDVTSAACAIEAFDALMRYCDVGTLGLWRDQFPGDVNPADNFAPASSFYHIMLALYELVRVAERR